MPDYDWANYPELPNSLLGSELYFMSPHKQITEDFDAEVVKVHDGDTVRVKWAERDFDFPLRIINIDAPELGDAGGDASRDWLRELVLGNEVTVKINKKFRVDTFGRLVGRVEYGGVDVGQWSVMLGHAVPWNERDIGEIKLPKEMVMKHGIV